MDGTRVTHRVWKERVCTWDTGIDYGAMWSCSAPIAFGALLTGRGVTKADATMDLIKLTEAMLGERITLVDVDPVEAERVGTDDPMGDHHGRNI